MIIRGDKRKWTTVDNVWVKDPTLSAKAKGILIYILSLPDDWDIYIKELVTHFFDGTDGIKSGLVELKQKGYIEVVAKRAKNGKITTWDYYIFENPQTEALQVEKPLVVDPTLLSTKEKLNTKKTNVDLANYKEPIEVLNQLTGRSFKVDNGTYLGMIRARVKDGSSLEEVIEVIKYICKERMGTKFETFLRPSTVFSRTKYDNYKAEYKFLIKDLTNEQKCAILSIGWKEDGKMAISKLKDLD